MKTLIPPSSYLKSAVLSEEVSAIFKGHWIFACALNELPNDEDYVCLDFAGVSIVVQNFEGSIRAFDNVCTHRFSRIQDGECGNRTFRCPYHGWYFNAEGIPYAIPSKPTIRDITPENLCDYRLARWHVKVLGSLVFIKKETSETLSETDFEEQLGAFAPVLLRFAESFGELIEQTHYTVKANWKVLVENTLEGYHVEMVHPESIERLMPTEIQRIDADGEGASFETVVNDEYLTEKPTRSVFIFSRLNSAVYGPWKASLLAQHQRFYPFLSRGPVASKAYRHHYLFPNFVLASTLGASFSLQRFLPLDAQRTLFSSYTFSTKIEGGLSKREKSFHKIFNEGVINAVKTIFNEDAEISEKVQKGIANASRGGVLSDEEERICDFHQAYLRIMQEASKTSLKTF